MHIPKISNIGNKLSYIWTKRLGNEKNYFMSHQQKILNDAHKLISNMPKNQYYIDINSDTEFDINIAISDTSDIYDKNEVLNILYLAPKNYPLYKWLIKLKIAKYFFNLEGVPYDWISNYGKLKIHHMAYYLYLKEYERNKNVNKILSEVEKDLAVSELKKLVIPKYDPSTKI